MRWMLGFNGSRVADNWRVKDAILGITEAFKADSFKEKINLGVGAYRASQPANGIRIAVVTSMNIF